MWISIFHLSMRSSQSLIYSVLNLVFAYSKVYINNYLTAL